MTDLSIQATWNPSPPPRDTNTQTTRLYYRFFFVFLGAVFHGLRGRQTWRKGLSDRTSDYRTGMSWRGSSDKSVWFHPGDDLLSITFRWDGLCNQKSWWEGSLRLASARNWLTCFHYYVFFTEHECVSTSSWTAWTHWPSLVTWDCKYLQIRTVLSWVMNAFA